MQISFSKVTVKGQATIPQNIRKHLNLKPGERVAFQIVDDRVELRRADPVDLVFHQAQEANLSREWLSAEDEAAYGDL
ncbi:MAG: AbrB/MazE/SpoVT family DNA-binding domain-containing protein [Opitutales bacterium]